ncbi:hypothetical protein Cantr_02079 [Candida viswanathii]|uniref:Uncharacterized protein n=1 Tax=Candida viswanathii TaxID=5486 RepID=A0A367YK59_9ASCO|nr:hypothetical protein Cantr_02079 [Candida viswanathii]
MNENTNDLENRVPSSAYLLTSSERKSTVLQETSSNIMNRSPKAAEKKVVVEQESRKRAAVSPIKSINEPVRRKLDRDAYVDEDLATTPRTGVDQEEEVDIAAELEYRNWVLEQRLQQAKEINEFLLLEREFSRLD